MTARPREIIYQYYPCGRYVRVTAMDPDSLTEVAIVGDPSRGEEALRAAAERKLLYVLKRDAAQRRPRR
jgi:hypothetical protein